MSPISYDHMKLFFIWVSSKIFKKFSRRSKMRPLFCLNLREVIPFLIAVWYIHELFLFLIETQNLTSCLKTSLVKPLDLFTNRCSKMALIRDEKDEKYLCSETKLLLGLELSFQAKYRASLFLKSLVTPYQIHFHWSKYRV